MRRLCEQPARPCKGNWRFMYDAVGQSSYLSALSCLLSIYISSAGTVP